MGRVGDRPRGPVWRSSKGSVRAFSKNSRKSILFERSLNFIGSNLPILTLDIDDTNDDLVYRSAQLEFSKSENALRWALPTRNFEKFGLYPNTIPYKDIVILE
jgi:hypothetical protein